jgi:hypothetical protein
MRCDRLAYMPASHGTAHAKLYQGPRYGRTTFHVSDTPTPPTRARLRLRSARSERHKRGEAQRHAIQRRGCAAARPAAPDTVAHVHRSTEARSQGLVPDESRKPRAGHNDCVVAVGDAGASSFP